MAGEIFIGYRRSDEPNARLLYTPLQERGVEAWYDARVTAGEDRRTATAKALDAASTFVLLFSQNGLPSDDIAKELTAATKKKKVIIPVRLTNIQLRDPFLRIPTTSATDYEVSSTGVERPFWRVINTSGFKARSTDGFGARFCLFEAA